MKTMSIESAQKLLKEHTGLTSDATDWSYESILLERDELDPEILPEMVLLPDSVNFRLETPSANRSHQYE